MKNKLLSSIFMVCLLTCFIQAQGQAVPQKNAPVKASFTGLAYANASTQQTLDLFIPQEYAADKKGRGNKNTLYPVILAITNMNNGTYGDISTMLQALPYGYAVAALKYRDTFPQSVEDIFSAIAWVKEKGKQYQLHPQQIVLWGSSKGGYLAALTGCAGTYPQGFESEMDFDTPKQIAKAQATEQADQHLVNEFEGTLAQNKAKVQAVIDFYGSVQMPGNKITPQMFITPQAPPFFMVYGERDPIIPYTQAEHFSTALQEAIGSSLVEFILLPDAGHGGVEYDNPQLIRQIFVFLNRVIF